MGLADRVAERRAERELMRTDPVTMEEFGYLLGQGQEGMGRYGGRAVKTKSGVTMGPRRALGISAWYSGVRYISETIAGLPTYVYRDTPEGRVVRASPNWMKRPDVEMTWFGLIEFFLMSLLHKGNAYAYKLRGPVGDVNGLRALHPDRVKVGQADDGTKVFCLDGRHDLPFTSLEILHIPGLSYDGVIGLNPIEILADSLGLVAAADEYAGRAMDGNHLNVYLTVPPKITQEEANTMKATWDRMHRGLVNAHEIAVMGGGAEYKTIDLNPEQLQLLESRKFGVTEVARILRLPPHKLYDLERATFSNIEQQSIEAGTDGIVPWCSRMESWISADPDLTPARNFLEFDVEGLFRGDMAGQYEAWAKGIQGGFIQPCEPRRRLNLPYVDGSEFLLRPLAMQTYGADAVPLPEAPTVEAPTNDDTQAA